MGEKEDEREVKVCEGHPNRSKKSFLASKKAKKKHPLSVPELTRPRNLDEWILSTSADRALRVDVSITPWVDPWSERFERTWATIVQAFRTESRPFKQKWVQQKNVLFFVNN